MRWLGLIAVAATTRAAYHAAATPVPVRITNFPSAMPDHVALQTLWYAQATFWGTVIFGVITAGGIVLAIMDLRLNRDQAAKADAERAKQPNLSVMVQMTPSYGPVDAEGFFETQIALLVSNRGSAPASNIELTASFPATTFQQEAPRFDATVLAQNASLQRGIKNVIRLSPQADSFGNRWDTIYDRNLELLPGQQPVTLGTGTFRVREGETFFLWRVKCRQGDFPGTHNGMYQDARMPVHAGRR